MLKFLSLEQDLIEILEKIQNIIYNLDEGYNLILETIGTLLIIIIILLFFILLFTIFNYLQNKRIKDLFEYQEETKTYYKKRKIHISKK